MTEPINTYSAMNDEIAKILRMSGEQPDLYAAQYIEELQAEVERLRRECDDLEAIVGNYRTALLWIVAHDQTMRPNGGDPEWFAEEAPYRARKALAE
jgi:hypothetical protein